MISCVFYTHGVLVDIKKLIKLTEITMPRSGGYIRWAYLMVKMWTRKGIVQNQVCVPIVRKKLDGKILLPDMNFLEEKFLQYIHKKRYTGIRGERGYFKINYWKAIEINS